MGFRSRRDLPWFSSASFLFLALIAPVLGDGVDRVSATRDTIVVSGKGVAPAALAEVVPGHLDPISLKNSKETNALPGGVFRFELPRFVDGRDRLYSAFASLAETNGSPRHVEQMDGVSGTNELFPSARNKKGLQVQMVDDALKLGISHAALNVNFAQLLAPSETQGSVSWTNASGEFQFNGRYVQSLDSQIKPLSDAGVVVSLILLSYVPTDPVLKAALVHPSYDTACPNHLSAFNVITPTGVRHFQACVEFLADRYSRTGRSHGRVAGYIIGNEVNSHWYWYNMGNASMEKVAEDYLRAVRMAFYAIRKSSSSARVYLSLEHHWNIRYPAGSETQSFPARPFLEYFARQARASGDFEWYLAFHPYPENLGQPRTWLDKTATPLADTPRVTFKNLDVLVRFMGKSEMLFSGNPRRIILSEQGFHSNGTPDGEQAQAAAFAYAYEKVAALDGIDSFILHRHVDHSKEGGLNLGLWHRSADSISNPSTPKPIYTVFKAAGTPGQAEAFAFALPVIGITGWESVRTGKR